ncbi:hypothetical protein Cni_G17876 [Canna indica]|uniref:Uncharacterized protein n=1 Tax=Canna indica TaxID=4628 RepID=A0AAQ3KHV0_9LILI|nr:hypothetical protein Cni_G17876 [Canna indica]
MKPHKGRPRKKVTSNLPCSSSVAPPPPPRQQPDLPPPPPARLFPNYPSPSSTSSTHLPPPSMPKKPFLHRILPLVVVGSAAYMYMGRSKKHVTENDGKFGPEDCSIPAQRTETTS